MENKFQFAAPTYNGCPVVLPGVLLPVPCRPLEEYVQGQTNFDSDDWVLSLNMASGGHVLGSPL